MTAEVGVGGVYVPPDVGLPTRCFGVAKANSSNGHKSAWVALIFAGPTSGACPQAATGGPPPSPPPGDDSPTATSTNTKTPTSTPTKTPTPTPTSTPLPHYSGYTLSIQPGAWVLVTLPPGPIQDVLARVRGCYEAVYQLQGDQWLRYSPDVPRLRPQPHLLERRCLLD